MNARGFIVLTCLGVLACTQREIVVQGADGEPGKDGAPGAGVVVMPVAPGDAECPAGGVKVSADAGDAYVCNGANGSASELSVTSVAPGVDGCAAGGVRVGGVGESAVICNGVTGAPGSPGTAASGSRLSPVWLEGTDGARLYQGWFFDSERGEKCSVQSVASSQICLPTALVTATWGPFADASCSTRAAAWNPPAHTNSVPDYVLVHFSDTASAVYTRGEKIPPLTGAGCNCNPDTVSLYQYRADTETCRCGCHQAETEFYALGQELPLSTFVEFEERH